MKFSWTRHEIEKIRKILNETDGLNYISVKDANFMFDKVCEALTVDEKKSSWIPVAERVPEESLDSVLGWDERRKRCVFIQYMHGEFRNLGTEQSFNITAWMPTPEPYRGNGNE